MAKRKRDQPEPLAETMLDQELIVFLTERSQSGDPLTAEEFPQTLWRMKRSPNGSRR